MADKLNQLTLKQAVEGLKEKKFSSAELHQSIIKRINEVEGKIFSFVEIVDKENPKQIEKEGILKGAFFAVKDVLSTKDIRSTASSKILANYVPVYEATVVKKLTDHGAEIIGKTNCDAFAFGASTENSGFGPTKNPWNTTKVPGGSSGGSAAAVAADECLFSLGTDTGGSIRQPASFCSVTGLKPTFGACSRFGLLAMASSFDCPGPIGKTVEDCEIVFDIIKGKDEKDATSVFYPKKKQVKKNLVIGLPKEFFGGGVENEVKNLVSQAAKILEKEGHRLVEISLPNTSLAISVYYILVPSEISSNMARYDGIRFGSNRESFENEVKRRIMLGTYTLESGYFDQYYLKAAKVRNLVKADYLNAFEKVDLILGPVSPTPPFGIGELINNPLKMYLSDVLTVGANLAGIPGLSIPCGFTHDNLPVGLQLLSPHFSEEILFDIGRQFQQITDWHKRKPKL
ncbi:Asp-tRNA(Asn)/Glu-tRNA(Gln) amidotransferase GatCAB subunit A [Candidatus Shapirobacteria bacterium CG03_land_8_20_14_0_80_40_19]|uniref:Glutamyl-tRNA(Gln) amidotransferase subunit A n=3 Tax=Candidatus Shapironibacteriota TaxID=1752721 RepID=A0A2M7BAV5_9BACT|nr:MAG: Asp-tRNA(Asn)/Glu-tRNA(Gln) amidotransferase GatCAB subunit A [Candidatus Shapirobacteria bacterium CG11_big_fil_rev_8_21_14_0_20_40_12]PIV00268.1 MAG: Asp-tRNA(Asn)/Glu-tRNA(Gln) amidotransferase GatCAB subunit A [Candidatus Shapirobacteria bacterium CG03_land_8_20_14_0_80_40_19]PJC29074.1 MAG: Asp-tRNA(Asn)/Glu-tRNA(Gln) amidotransferase GatCAB subunit A [Candidatus Shapirobacteria bacterium CG_4_9_14_0_2_um_filter_40_11]